MSFFDKQVSFYDKYTEIKNDYNKCVENVKNVEQHKFEIKNRIEKSQKLINNCKNIQHDKLKLFFNSDIDFYRYYDNERPDKFNKNLFLKDTVDFLSDKY